MADNEPTGSMSAIRSAALTFTGDPFADASESCTTYLSDAVLVMEGGSIRQFGPVEEILSSLGPDVPVEHYPDSLLLPRLSLGQD